MDEQNIGGEEAASLAALQALAGEGEPAPGTVQESTETGPQGVDLAGEISAAVQMAMAVLKPVLPSVAALYTPEVTAAVGASVAGVCNKHGWLQGGMMGEWGEEIACLAVCGPLAVATYQAAQTDLAVRRAKEIKQPEPPVTVTGGTVQVEAAEPSNAAGKTVQFGTVQE